MATASGLAPSWSPSIGLVSPIRPEPPRAGLIGLPVIGMSAGEARIDLRDAALFDRPTQSLGPVENADGDGASPVGQLAVADGEVTSTGCSETSDAEAWARSSKPRISAAALGSL